MRRDLLIAIMLAIAAIPAGAALMVAPEYLHLTGFAVPLTFWGGIGLSVVLILISAILAWRSRPPETAKAATLATFSPHCDTPHDVAMIDAIWRVFMGRWGKRKRIWSGEGDPNKGLDFIRFYDICDDIRQKAFEGALPIWAVRENSQLYEPVPLEFWLNRRLLPQIMMQPEWKETWVVFTHVLQVGESPHARSQEWARFMTNKAIVEKLWPPAQPR